MNEVLFGVCSNDVLFSLTSDEVSQNIEGNRLARLAGHLLQQQSFSPQFPVPQNLLAQVNNVYRSVLFFVQFNEKQYFDDEFLHSMVQSSNGHNTLLHSMTCATRSTGSSRPTRTC